MILNRWPDKVSDKAISLLNRWIEYYAGNICNSPFVPTEAKRYLFKKSIDVEGKCIFRVEILEGIDNSRSTAPREVSKMIEFGFAFRSLSDMDQLIILAQADPFDELNTKESWSKFLIDYKIGNNGDFNRLLIMALVDLQTILEKKKLVEIMTRDLRGWRRIADYLNVSVPTAKKYTRELGLPISMLGGSVFSSEEKIDVWKERVFKENQIGGLKCHSLKKVAR
jgi:hypothetical protein